MFGQQVFRTMGVDARMAYQAIASGSGRETLRRGGKQLGGLLGRHGIFSSSDDRASAAWKALGSGWRTMGFRGMRSGALMGAAGGVGLQLGSNVLSGENLTYGLGGAAMRGAMFGGAAGAGLGMSLWAGRTGRTGRNPFNAPVGPAGPGRMARLAQRLGKDRGMLDINAGVANGAFGWLDHTPRALRRFHGTPKR